MKYYQIILDGHNFLINMDGDESLFGFVAKRFVEAVDKDQAIEVAVDLVREDILQEFEVLNGSDAGVQPMIYVEELLEISVAEMDHSYRGYTWYPMVDE